LLPDFDRDVVLFAVFLAVHKVVGADVDEEAARALARFWNWFVSWVPAACATRGNTR
jgi:hypothetical protein